MGHDPHQPRPPPHHPGDRMGVSGIIPVIIRWREQQNQPRPPSPMTSPDPGHAPLARPVIFGLADGMMSLLGVVLYLLGHQALIFPAALSGGISSALSMAGGEWLSDSENGLTASAAMGAATGLGAVLPALPYAFTTGTTAIAESVTICLMIGLCVAFLRPGRSLPVALTETFSILLAIFGVVLLCGLILPGAAA